MHNDMEMMLSGLVHTVSPVAAIVAIGAAVLVVVTLFRLPYETLNENQTSPRRYFPYNLIDKSHLTDRGLILRRRLLRGFIVLLIAIGAVLILLIVEERLPIPTIDGRIE